MYNQLHDNQNDVLEYRVPLQSIWPDLKQNLSSRGSRKATAETITLNDLLISGSSMEHHFQKSLKYLFEM
jgi:hypothetical protein